jgi:hypothetical protein
LKFLLVICGKLLSLRPALGNWRRNIPTALVIITLLDR